LLLSQNELEKLMAEVGKSIKIDRSKKSLRELTLEKMRTLIIEQYFEPGQRLVERTLCDQLGVSRTVVREVLRHLETEGLVQTVAFQGPIVATIDADTTRQVYEMRSLLEGHAAAACAARADDETIARMGASLMLIESAFARSDYPAVMDETSRFYSYLYLGSGESVAWSIVQTLNARINSLRAITIRSPNRGSVGPVEMRRMLNAIQARDAVAARKAAEAHIANAATIALTALAPGAEKGPIKN
jgi:DNA-binding GntR family transcriptional regulator